MKKFDTGLIEVNQLMLNVAGLSIGTDVWGVAEHLDNKRLFNVGKITGYKQKGKFQELFILTDLGYELPYHQIEKKN